VFVLPLAVLFLGERVTARHALLAFVALAGAALVIRPASGPLNVPGLLALLSALFSAIAYVLVSHLSARESAHTIVFWFAGVSTVATAPLLAADFVLPSAVEAATLLAMGLLGLAGQLLMTVAYRLGEAGRLAVLGSLGAVFGAGWDLLLWRHVPDGWTVLGGVTVIGACAGIQLLRRSPVPTRPA
jgi:drug/metabolite transporter (DMT)-like permease